ncbi:unnamed protein product [Rotaria sordida]|uniref:Uncharacterized protein n=1 Tax=Rotaria sordida TaxID=392033 RepID=A0A815HHJ0_9BILA|nr:unnamed protein product [Rotaria sordida]CAF1602525.1 unnamed protein product [Rotaria sordida]
MRLLFAFFLYFLCLEIGFLRTANSITVIVPEIDKLAIRYYCASSSSLPNQHHREKRFLFTENPSKDNAGFKGSVLEQMVANTFKDVNYTKVALLVINNNETMFKIRQNINADAIIPAIMRDIDYEKLGKSLYYAAEVEFDFEHFIESIINITYIDTIHEELIEKWYFTRLIC